MNDIKKSGHYDIEVAVIEKAILESTTDVDTLFYLTDLNNRKLYLVDAINDYSVQEIVRHILQFNREDNEAGIAPEERKPIKLYINSPGGDVVAGFMLINIIENSATPVYTINMAKCYSMAFMVALAGHKRFALRDATYLMHDGQNFIYDSGSKAQDTANFNKAVEARVKDYILGKSNISTREYNKKLRVEWYMFSDEARDRGVVDYIVGEDIPLDEII